MKKLKEIKNSLLLTRKEKERIIILVGNKKIIVGLDSIATKKARVRVHADEDVQIYREEIYLEDNCLFKSCVQK